ncbi:MAG: hypothetical protein PUP91_18190 [Rhizonema sp. PD37]|nr:hypothetical protein [Rhizonema sp. PD37]
MKFKLLSLSLFSITALSPFIVPSLIPSAQAGCIAVDVGTQVAIDGQRVGHQTNRTSQNFGPNCDGTSGSKVTTVGTQTCVSGRCVQRRNSSQYVDGDPNSRIGVRTPNIGIRVKTPVHVYNPSLDSNSPLNTNRIFHNR